MQQDVASFHSPIPLAPQHPTEEDEDSNTGVGAGVKAGEEMESDVVPPQVVSKLRSKSNQDSDLAREGLTRSRKRYLPLSSGESSGKLPALSPIYGKVAPLKPKKTLTTLGGRRDNPSGGSADASKSKTA